MKNFIANLSSRPRNALFTLIGWFVLFGIVATVAPPLSEVTTNQQEEFLPVGAESVRAINLEREKYPVGGGIPAIAVFHSHDGFDDKELEAIKSFVDFLESDEKPEMISGVLSIFRYPKFAASLISPDGDTMTVLINVNGEPSNDDFQETIDTIIEKAHDVGAFVEIDVGVTGPASIITDAIRVFKSIDFQVTTVTVIIVLLILFIIYRSPGLALVPLLLVGTSLLIAQGLAALVADNFGLPVNQQVTSIMSVLLFGAGTDYVLFIISRYREELNNHANRFGAMAETMRRVAPSIMGSAGTTIIAMLLLIFSLSGSFKTMGPMLALAIGVVLLAGLTVMPTTIVLMGKWAFWPVSVESNIKRATTAGIWHSVGRIVSTKPKIVFITTTVILISAAIPIFYMVPSFNFLDGYPDDAESKVGYKLMQKGFPAGELSPTMVFITTESGNIVDQLDVVEQIATTIESMDGVSRVSGRSRPNGYVVPEDSDEFMMGLRFNSQDGSTTRLEVIFDEDPYSEQTLIKISEIRNDISGILESSNYNGVEVLVGGDTAIVSDDKSAIDRDMVVLAPVILLAVFMVLIVLQRAVVVPIYLMFSIIISYAATYGFSIFIFQNILGHNGVAYSNGVWIFVFLVALGADYNIFVMSRIREEVTKSGFQKGIAAAVGRTGGVVTSAGIILAGTFSVLTTLPLRDIFQLGFAVMLGVLIDTFIVRALLVPSMAAMIGKYNWWPSKLTHK